MAISSKALANFLLDLGERDSVPITPMKLQKLVYYCHGWYMAITGEPLINDQIEAWKYGPVVSTLFHEFKNCGSSPIGYRALEIRDTGKGVFGFEQFTPSIEDEIQDQRNLDDLKAIVSAVWDEYKKFSPTKLSNMTHEANGPWDQVVNQQYHGDPPGGTDIPTDLIRDHFLQSLERHRAESTK